MPATHASCWRTPLRHGLAVLGVACGVATAAPDIGQPWPVDTARLSATPGRADGDARLPDGTPLTLAALSDHALRHNPATRAAWAAAMADVAGVDAARALLWPTVTASVPLSLSHGGGQAGAAGADAPAGIVRAIAPSASLTWVLFDFGARTSAVDAARWQSVASQLAYNRELQTVLSNVELAYYTLLGAQRLQAALQSAVQAAQGSVEATQARRAAGLATLGEAAQAEAARGQAQLQLIQATAATHVAQGTLANAVGIAVTTPLWLDDGEGAATDDADTQALIAGVPDAQWLDIARRSRADLAALDAQVLQGEAQVAATQAAGRPSLSLSAAAARRWGSDGSGSATQQVALTLSIPIFDGGLVRAQTQAARARVQALTAQRDQQRQAVDLEVWQSLQTFESSAAAVASARALLRSAAVAEDAARERYGAGVGTVLELLVAQSTAAQARVSLVQARYDGQMALTKLGYALGAGLAASPMNRTSPGARP